MQDNYCGLAGGTQSESSKGDIEFETLCDEFIQRYKPLSVPAVLFFQLRVQNIVCSNGW